MLRSSVGAYVDTNSPRGHCPSRLSGPLLGRSRTGYLFRRGSHARQNPSSEHRQYIPRSETGIVDLCIHRVNEDCPEPGRPLWRSLCNKFRRRYPPRHIHSSCRADGSFLMGALGDHTVLDWFALPPRFGPISLNDALHVWASFVARRRQAYRFSFHTHRKSWDTSRPHRQFCSHGFGNRRIGSLPIAQPQSAHTIGLTFFVGRAYQITH